MELYLVVQLKATRKKNSHFIRDLRLYTQSSVHKLFHTFGEKNKLRDTTTTTKNCNPQFSFWKQTTISLKDHQHNDFIHFTIKTAYNNNLII